MSKNITLSVAAYCRVSTDKLDQQNSLHSQREFFERYISSQPGWTLRDIYFDEGISGTSTKKRTGFVNMMNDALCGKINLILTKEVSRFARNTVDVLSFTRKLKACGVGVIFLSDGIDTRDGDGELRLAIMASIAQEESRKTSERVKWGQKRRMEQGVVFGRDLLGYTVSGGKLTINTTEAETVRWIYNAFLNRSIGAYVIANELNERDTPTKHNNPWSATAVLRVLRNEKYMGDLCQKKSYTPNYLTHEKARNCGAEDMVYIQGHHEGIIDREQWFAVQNELKHRNEKKLSGSRHSGARALSGKLRCAVCGDVLVSRVKALKNGGEYRSWRCVSPSHGAGPRAAIAEKTLLACAAFVLESASLDREKILRDLLADIASAQNAAENKSSAPAAKLNKLRQKKRRAIDLALSGIVSHEDLAQQIEQIDAELLRCEREVEAGADTSSDKCASGYITAIQSILDFDCCHTLPETLLDSASVTPGGGIKLWMRHMPPVMLMYKTNGKLESFTVTVLQAELCGEIKANQ